MPFKSLKQKKLVLAAAHNKEFADKVGFEQSAAKKFMKDSLKEKQPTKEYVESKPKRFSNLFKKIGG